MGTVWVALWHWYRYLHRPGVGGLPELRSALSTADHIGTMLAGRSALDNASVLAGLPVLLRERAQAAAARNGILRRLGSTFLPRLRKAARPSTAEDGALAPDVIDQMVRLLERFDRDREVGVLETILENQGRWLDSGLLSVRETAAVLTDHAKLALRLGELGLGQEYFAEAEAIARKAVLSTRTEEHDPHLANRLRIAARSAANQHDGTPGAPAFIRAADDLRRAVEAARSRTPVLLEPARELIEVLMLLHEATGTTGALSEAWTVARDLVRATVPEHREHSAHRRLEVALRRMAVDQLGDASANAVGSSAPGSAGPDAVKELWSVADNFDATSATRWRAAIDLLDTVPGGHQDRPLALVMAAEAELRHWQTGADEVTPQTARNRAMRAVDAAPPGHPLAGRALVALAETTIHAASHTAADVTPAAIAQAPGGGGRWTAETLGDAAVATVRQAVPLLPRNVPDTASALIRLANVLNNAAIVLSDNTLVPESVTLRREAMELTPADDPSRPFRLSDLAHALQTLAEMTNDFALSDESVTCAREAADTLPEDHPAKHELLFNLGVRLSSDPIRDQDAIRRLTEAEHVYRLGLTRLPADHPDLPQFLNAIGRVKRLQYEETGDRRTLEDAVAVSREAVARTSRDDTLWGESNERLARACTALDELNDPADPVLRAEAMAAWKAAATDSAMALHRRVDAQEQRAALALAAGDPAIALQALEAALDVIPVLFRRSLTGPSRKGSAMHSSRLAARAAEAALGCGRPDRAVELLEHSRAVLYGQMIATRRYWAPLQAIDPEAAQRLTEIDSQLGSADVWANVIKVNVVEVEQNVFGRKNEKNVGSIDPRPDWAARTRQLAAERCALVERLARHPDFDELMRPEPLHQLRARLAGSPVVLVMTHRECGDALLVPADPEGPVIRVPLPGLTEAAVQKQVHRLETAVADAGDVTVGFDRRESAQAQVHEVLEWLWDEVTGPILERLPQHNPGLGDLPRLWWCPVGPVARLPLHAAGHHRAPRTGKAAGDQAPRSVVDRVIPSYTPTLGALAHALRNTPPEPARRRSGALVVAVPETPGLPPLPLAEREADVVMEAVHRSRLLLGAEASLSAVEAALRDYQIIHFACHGDSDARLAILRGGGLHLASGETLTAVDIHHMRLEHGALAFLSACDTGKGHPDLPDEPLHLAAAFQLAGFRSVIGTLWLSPDNAAVARAVYASLTAQGTRPPDTTVSAEALNTALRMVRDTYPAAATRWVAYVHIGA
ncbi:CHAT domain-containing protein [Lentzea sp. BCCO 10_0061]|uniref:CHAT domain-containing protein n=1 Tax=Lentzea sokolovensis TaxID=3095429 RepID=A0ABU4UQ84_9PSEU|nr:CHAT domain-containing protein [Lentzea sp. BCCO 10_0061]